MPATGLFYFLSLFACTIRNSLSTLSRKADAQGEKQMAKRGPKSKYADEQYTGNCEEAVLDLPEHQVMLAGALGPGCAVRFDAGSGTSDEFGPSMNTLGERSGGDWSWNPGRNALFPQFGMPEYRPPAHHPLCGIRPFACACRA